MPVPSLIFDANVFYCFDEIEDNKTRFTNILRSLTINKILVPQEVHTEIERMGIKYPRLINQSQFWSNQIITGNIFKLCNTFDSVVMDFAKSRVDAGEAEAIAQSQETKVSYFITEEIKCLPFIKEYYSHIKTYSTFFLISLADLSGLLPNYNEIVKKYLIKVAHCDKRKPNKQKEISIKLRYEYAEAQRMLGFPKDKKLISQKTNIKNLLK